MQRLLTTLLLLAVIVGAVAFVAAPYAGFFALRSAAQSQDSEALVQLIDYDAVRASLKPQMTGAVAEGPPPSFWQHPIDAVKHAIEPMQPAPDVDAYLKPQSLAALTMGDGRGAVRVQTVDPNAKGHATDGPWPRVRYWGVNRCRLAIPSSDPAWMETVFTFERKGIFTWKLVHIGLPSRAPAATAPVAAPASSAAPAPAR